MCTMPNACNHISDCFKTQEMCNKTVEVDLWQLKDVTDRFKTQEMCNEAVHNKLCLMLFVLGWFVTQQQIHVWYDDDYGYNDNEMIKWYDVYKARKPQKAKIKEDHLPISWHLDPVMDCCMLEDEKRRWK